METPPKPARLAQALFSFGRARPGQGRPAQPSPGRAARLRKKLDLRENGNPSKAAQAGSSVLGGPGQARAGRAARLRKNKIEKKLAWRSRLPGDQIEGK